MSGPVTAQAFFSHPASSAGQDRMLTQMIHTVCAA